MSIVERAMEKLAVSRAAGGSSEPRPAPVPASQPSTAAEPAPERTAVVAAPAVPAGIDPASLQTINLDLERLNAAGVLPPAAFAHQVQNELRRVKSPLLAALLGRGGERIASCNRMLVTSALPDEGKTFTSLNLALSLAREKGTVVLLVDADMARATLSQRLGVMNRPGLADLLEGERTGLSDTLLATGNPQLLLLPAGRPTPLAPELIASERMSMVAQMLTEAVPNGIVLFDTPPLLATNDAQVLSQYVGFGLVVVRADSTPKAAIRDAVSMLPPSLPAGCVLNRAARVATSEYYGRYAYGTRDSGGGAKSADGA